MKLVAKLLVLMMKNLYHSFPKFWFIVFQKKEKIEEIKEIKKKKKKKFNLKRRYYFLFSQKLKKNENFNWK
jgi:hypothetical protein